MAPVILQMDVHCLRCARRIREAVQNVHGVEDVWVSVDKGRVEIAGASLDAWHLRRRIQSRTRKPVTIVSDGSGAAEELPAGQMVHLGPTPPAPLGYSSYSYPYGYGGYGGGWAAPTALQYVSGNAFPPSYDARQYYGNGMMMANDAPPCYRDDGPSGCCTMQ